MATATHFVKIRNPTAKVWASSSKDVWNEDIEYVLRTRVRGREVEDQDDNVVKAPAWSILMHYEYELRKKAWTPMNEGTTDAPGIPLDIAVAMKLARDCPETRQEQFL